jgi:hypothetical protein
MKIVLLEARDECLTKIRKISYQLQHAFKEIVQFKLVKHHQNQVEKKFK